MHRVLVILAMVSLACTACRKDAASRAAPAAPAENFAIHKPYGSGPVKFTVDLSQFSITTAEALKCRLTLSVASGYEADFPDLAFPEDMPGSILTSFEEHTSTQGDRRIFTRDYEIEPEYEGTLTLPRLEVYSHKSGEVKEDVLETEPLEVKVKSHRETAGDIDFKPMRPLATVEQIEALRRRVWPWIVGGVAAALAVAGLVVYLIRRPRYVPLPPPAHETALKRLRQLAERGLIAAGAAEAFFIEVTAIVREYIEQAFGVHAPEQTTEEFLARMVTSPSVARHRAALEPFLIAADEVKFARLLPDAGVMQRAFATAEDFVLESSGLRTESAAGTSITEGLRS